ncbi:MAG: heparinase II/III family protein, partial [Prosthecobacter sp.]|nr:heparinase II/III family protein [Prosthecobacter sp.]
SLQINSIVSSLEGQALIPNLEEFVEKALAFMAYMIRPDGCFPPIGDTCTAPPRNKFEWLKAFKGYREFEYALTQGKAGAASSANHKILPVSGYAIFRGDGALFSQEDRLHLVYKCGFLSHYHRQDDDNHITLFAFGEEWLADGGLYIHDHHDAAREYLRSALSHNVFVPMGVKAERRNRPKHPPAITEFDESDTEAMVRGSSNVHAGFVCSREVRYSGALAVQILDHASSIDGSVAQYQQLWQVPGGHIVSVHPSGFFARSRKTGVVMVVTIAGDGLVDVEIVKDDPSILSVRSQSYGELEPVTVVRAKASGTEVGLEVEIEFLKPGVANSGP